MEWVIFYWFCLFHPLSRGFFSLVLLAPRSFRLCCEYSCASTVYQIDFETFPVNEPAHITVFSLHLSEPHASEWNGGATKRKILFARNLVEAVIKVRIFFAISNSGCLPHASFIGMTSHRWFLPILRASEPRRTFSVPLLVCLHVNRAAMWDLQQLCASTLCVASLLALLLLVLFIKLSQRSCTWDANKINGKAKFEICKTTITSNSIFASRSGSEPPNSKRTRQINAHDISSRASTSGRNEITANFGRSRKSQLNCRVFEWAHSTSCAFFKHDKIYMLSRCI